MSQMGHSRRIPLKWWLWARPLFSEKPTWLNALRLRRQGPNCRTHALQQTTSSFDYFVGKRSQLGRDLELERPSVWTRKCPAMAYLADHRNSGTSEAQNRTTVRSGYAPSALRTRSGANGSSRSRTPVSAAMALPTAPATSATPSSPAPVGAWSVESTFISILGTSDMRAT